MTGLYFLIHLKNDIYMTVTMYCSGFATCHPERMRRISNKRFFVVALLRMTWIEILRAKALRMTCFRRPFKVALYMTVLYFLIRLKNDIYMTIPMYCSGFATCHPEPPPVILSECEGSLTRDSSSLYSSEWHEDNEILRHCVPQNDKGWDSSVASTFRMTDLSLFLSISVKIMTYRGRFLK